MVDYTGSSSNKNEKDKKPKPEKAIVKVVTSEVVVQKKPLGRKIKDLFIEADFKSVVRYVGSEVLLPAARNMIVDSSTKFIERMMYGERAVRQRNFGPGTGSRISYNNPINRGEYRDPRTRPPEPSRYPRRDQNDFILGSREEAMNVLEMMNNLIDIYEVATVADLNDLVGFPSTHVDNKWGWSFLGNVKILQVRQGYLLDLPPAEAIA